MSWLDVLLIALVALSIYGGYRRGAVLQVIGLIGLVVGVTLGALAAPHLARIGHDPTTHLALVAGVVILGGAVGNFLGWLAGTRLRAHTGDRQHLRRLDAVGGSVVSVLALLAVTWFLALNLVNGPFPGLARGIKGSRIVRELALLPPPPSLLGEAQRILSLLGFPDVFVGLPPTPSPPVAPPSGTQAKQAFDAAAHSTFEILGDGCYTGFLNQGSGFVVRPGYVITNAHVVAGTTRQWIRAGGANLSAQVVAFDPREDLALLHVPTLTAKALPLVQGAVGRGAVGAVVGFPKGGPLTGDAAAVRAALAPEGRDIYGHGEITRNLYEIQAEIRHGNSGGPFILSNGQVAGVVFASSVVANGVGYAIASTEASTFVRGATGATLSVSTGTCTGT
jgi:S1-C subfamily serine protease